MGLLDEIKAEVTGAHGPRCPVARARQEMSKTDVRELDAALEDQGVTHAAIHRALNRRGIACPAQGVSNHRSGSCACARKDG